MIFISATFAGTPLDVASTNAIKWYRDSAERNAIYHEVFLLGGNAIKQKVTKEKLKPHKWGVVFDIDETLLDNSQWNFQHDIHGNPQEWNDFAGLGISLKTPGAAKLTNEIHKLGGYVNLVSNRPATILAATEKNLKHEGIYYDQILLDTSKSTEWNVDKNSRFDAIIKGKAPSKFSSIKIIAWFGDNIQDFPHVKQAKIYKQNMHGAAYDPFGTTYFVIPNPMYGSWENNPLR